MLEQSNNLLYHGGGIAQGPAFLFSRQEGPNIYMAKAALWYVTGAHAFKVGFNNLTGHNTNSKRTVDSGTSYRFNLGVPNLITQYATPNARQSHLLEGAVFGQDKWTLKQFTINAGLRFDYFYTYLPEQVLGPGPLVPNRNITFQKQDWYQWKDLSPASDWRTICLATARQPSRRPGASMFWPSTPLLAIRISTWPTVRGSTASTSDLPDYSGSDRRGLP